MKNRDPRTPHQTLELLQSPSRKRGRPSDPDRENTSCAWTEPRDRRSIPQLALPRAIEPHPDDLCADCGHRFDRHRHLTRYCTVQIDERRFCPCTRFINAGPESHGARRTP